MDIAEFNSACVPEETDVTAVPLKAGMILLVDRLFADGIEINVNYLDPVESYLDVIPRQIISSEFHCPFGFKWPVFAGATP